MKFRTTVEATGKNTTGIEVPADLVAALGAGRRPPVAVTINGYTYRTTIGVMGGRQLLSVSADIRAAAGVAAGDEVDVELELDTAPRTVDVPSDLAAALDKSLRNTFEQLSHSRKQRLLTPIEQAKTPETRQRRITKAIDELRAAQPSG
ncbi:YdeI/OmpD-associated family protein [Nocardia sp. NBC_01327]|uniref:YdeI/OmpD-associated family protein n=1 Tax=Nocardia sp. NBC_01327 TaxID=2903593 RepID=UPI002E102E48|nr:YdeI/OmpD-associated family protein [Nocardia sp. NBC_01327]